MFRRQEFGNVSQLLLILAVAFLGHGIQLANGALHHSAIWDLGWALLALLAVGIAPRFVDVSNRFLSQVCFGLGVAVVFWNFRILATSRPAVYLQTTNFMEFAAPLVVFALATGGFLSAPKKWWWSALWATAFALLGYWLISASPAPAIDVWHWTHHALKNLLAGNNPYAISYPNIYGHTLWYPPGTADNEWVNHGYPYPPASLFISAAGFFFGDMRYANLALLILAGLCITFSKGRHSALAAALLLSTPRILFILEQSWTDAYSVGLFALVIFLLVRFPRLAPFAFGILVASKQYMIFVAPLALLVAGRSMRERFVFVAKSVATGLVITLPFLAWDPGALIKSLFISDIPFRADSLSFLASTAQNGVPTLPLMLQMWLLIPCFVLAYFFSSRTPAGFASAAALLLCVFFAFSKHAFCNHHFLTLGLTAVALGVIPAQSELKTAGESRTTS
jgi:hypothetical protein